MKLSQNIPGMFKVTQGIRTGPETTSKASCVTPNDPRKPTGALSGCMCEGQKSTFFDILSRFGVTAVRPLSPAAPGRPGSPRLICELEAPQRRSLGPEWTTGCLGVVNHHSFGFRGSWGVESGWNRVEPRWNRFFTGLVENPPQFRAGAHVRTL